MDANVTPFILKDGKRLITLTTLHFGPEEKIIAKIDNKESFSLQCQMVLKHLTFR